MARYVCNQNIFCFTALYHKNEISPLQKVFFMFMCMFIKTISNFLHEITFIRQLQDVYQGENLSYNLVTQFQNTYK